MVPLRVNCQGTDGYLAFWAGNLRSVYAMPYEYRSNDAYKTYTGAKGVWDAMTYEGRSNDACETYTDAKGVWIYYPMGKNEYIVKICRRPFSEGPRSSTLLACRLSPHLS